jgi:hypothetical protein
MRNQKIVIASVLITAIIAAAIFTSSYDIEESDPVQPPAMLMEVGGEVVRGLEGDFCWTSDNGTACVDKLDPSQLSTQIAVFSTDVGPDASYRFYPANYTDPANLTVEVRDSDGQKLSEHRYERDITFPLSSGTYFFVTRAAWPRGNVSHVFQVEVE